MNKLNKLLIIIISILIAILLFVLFNDDKYNKPHFDKNAIKGIPLIENNYYQQIDVTDGYSFKLYNDLSIKNNKLNLYFTSLDTNKYYLKLRIYDLSNNTIIAETGLLKPGYYLKNIEISNIKSEKDVIIKVMSYNPDTYFSEGVVNLKSVIKVGN